MKKAIVIWVTIALFFLLGVSVRANDYGSTTLFSLDTLSSSISQEFPEPSGGRTLIIPSVGINVAVGTFYLDGGSWTIAPWEQNAGHLEGTPWIDSNGNVVIGAHSKYPDGRPGVFRTLYDINIGDEIFVQDNDLQRRYVVVNIFTVDFRDVHVVYPTPHNQLTLITCDVQSYVAEQNWYYARLVIQAHEASA